MMEGLWGKKIGMTQVFSSEKKVVPVTAIDISNWYVTQIKTKEKDGYDAVQLGCIKDRYQEQEYSQDWLKHPQKYFKALKEVKLGSTTTDYSLGKVANISDILSEGQYVDIFGITKGAGFQGVVKRHGFAGGRASHGATFGRYPGALSHMRSRGRVIKGKKMPGHMGVEQRVMRNLEIVKIETEAKVVLVKGSVPGKSGSLVFVRKSRHG
ncbi:50S ribosomal protein L3 [Candidatus Babela massiliensis]|uniref:Large ribosomal subunit protein uL3 n=1 Tax=Candidatus Babela massiliensis TaxID=673862 RepID=V6DHV4_9BACT|nr:50S ribosomal protein L3 [Candidatus Babela massiliensis]CDK30513.1 Ribosomal protein L3 [Candidatus Babela massiliensis]